MGNLLKFLCELLAPWWHRKVIAYTLPVIVGSVVFAFTRHTTPSCYDMEAAIYGILSAAFITAVWVFTHHIPRVKPGRVGIVLATYSDEESEAKQLRIDFVRELVELLRTHPDGAAFEIVELPEYAANLVVHSNQGVKFLAKARGHLLLYGFSRKRLIDGKSMHLLELQGIVRHKPLPKEIGKKFSVHFGQVLPRKVMLPVDGDVLSFQITSSWVNICSRYIIAIAAHLSGDFVYSEALYLDVERLLVAINPIPKALEPLTLQLPKQIEALYIVWIEAIYQKYFFSRILESTKSIILSQVFQAVCDDIYSGCLGGYEVING